MTTNFIPMRKQQLIDACVEAADEDGRFAKLCRLIDATVHHRYQARIEEIERLYAPVDPDADTVSDADGGTSDGDLDELEQRLVQLLEDADYERLSHEQISQALHERALLRVRMDVDLDAYERVLLYGRGAARRTETVRRWLGLRKRRLEFTNYDRVLVYVRRPAATDAPDQDRSRIVVKMFRDVPEHDIEMLLPDPEVKMRVIDRLSVGVPAVVSGAILLATKAGPQLLLLGALLAFWLGLRDRQVDFDRNTAVGVLMGLMAVGSFMWRQVDKYRSRRLEFVKDVSERLYFKSLDNGAGVFYHLLDEAEDQECREAILAAHILHSAGGPMRRRELDERAQDWLGDHLGAAVDFEVADALESLDDFGLLERREERLALVPLEEALRKMDEAWDSEFEFAAH